MINADWHRRLCSLSSDATYLSYLYLAHIVTLNSSGVANATRMDGDNKPYILGMVNLYNCGDVATRLPQRQQLCCLTLCSLPLNFEVVLLTALHCRN